MFRANVLKFKTHAQQMFKALRRVQIEWTSASTGRVYRLGTVYFSGAAISYLGALYWKYPRLQGVDPVEFALGSTLLLPCAVFWPVWSPGACVVWGLNKWQARGDHRLAPRTFDE